MKIIECEQMSPEWYQARVGIPSSSNFDKIITTKGEHSKQSQKYLYRLAGEFVAGKSEETYQNAAMLRGIELEGEARQCYELITGETVDQVGFCLADEGYACSPDGMVGSEGLLEIKCPMAATHVGYLLKNELPSDYFQQVQGQLLVTSRKWCDFMSYYPGIKPLIIRVERDVKFLTYLKVELEIFCNELKEIINKIK